jgi:hypothetical protein
MKKALSLAIGLMMATCFYSYAQQRTASIAFKEESFDFGKIKEASGLVSHVFVFTNTGSVPLIIQNAQPSCGCTTPDWTKQPVMPGAKGFIKATFDPSGRPGTFEKSVTVFSNADRSPLILKFSGAVIPKPLTMQDEYRFTIGSLRLTSSYIGFGKLSPTGKKDTTIGFINAGKEPVTIKFIGIPSCIKVNVMPVSIKPNEKGVIKISYDASQKNDWGFLVDYMGFSINNKLDQAYRITVSSTIEEDFSKLTPSQLDKAPKIKFENTNFNFGTLKEGQKAEYEYKFKNEGKTNLLLHKVITSCGCTTTSQKETTIKPGASSSIKVTFNSSGKKGPQNKAVTVISNDPKSPSITLWIKGTVE